MWPFTRRKKKASRMYQGATYGRLVNDWITSSSSLDAEIRSSLKRLRDRTRQLSRDNDYVRQALRVIVNNVVGQGIPFQSQVRMQRGGNLNERVNAEIEQAWWAWSRKDSCHTGGTLSFCDIERLVIRSVAEGGEILVRMIPNAFGRSRVPLALEIVEADLLDDDKNEILNNGNEIRMGVERDMWQRPVAYHILKKHPGDYTFGSKIATNGRETIRVPASEIIHLYLTERPGQTRGAPWFASAVMKLHHMSGFEEATMIRARAAAALMGFISSPEGELQGDAVQDGERVSEFSPGVFKYLNPGEQVQVPSLPTNETDFDAFMRSMLRSIGAGVGVSYESLSRDYSQTNYSSSRQGMLEDRDTWRALQKWLIDSFHQVVFERWLDMAVMSQALSLPRYEENPAPYAQVRWMPRGWSWVDPAKEVAAYKDAVRSGFMTVSDVVAQSGGDFEELIMQRQREIQLAEQLGVTLETDPANDQPAQAPAPDSNADSQPNPADQAARILRELKAPEVKVDVHPPAIEAPTVNVTVERTGVIKKIVQRDEKGLISNIIEEEVKA